MFIEFNISYELLFISSSEWWCTKHNRKSNQFTCLHRFLCFRYFSIKIDKIDRLITEIDKIDNHKKLTDRFGTGPRTSRTSLIQLLVLLSGDIETCPGPIDRCGLFPKALKKNQSRMSCSQCHLKFHLKCFCTDDSGVKCNSCLIYYNNTQDWADKDQQENVHRHDIPELSKLASKKGLKILHQNIRGL